MKTGPLHRDIVLAGGGYAHLLFIRRWCMHPLPGVRVTLVSPQAELPYSGMLPAFLAGEYSHEDIHIDLVRLCQRAEVRLLLDAVTGIDAEHQRLRFATRPDLDYDLLSLNTGPVADTRVPGVAEYAIPVKPVAHFLQRWQTLLHQLRSAKRQEHVVMAGGGAGSVESLFGIVEAVRKDSQVRCKPLFTLLTASERLLPGYPVRVARAAARRCSQLGITIITGKRIGKVEQGHLFTEASEAKVLSFDHLLWCTGAAAPEWLRESGLALDQHGFVQVDDYLQSPSHATVFAVGDVASFSARALPKAGVYAVRQAPVLFHNLTSTLLQQPLRRYRPQSRFLSLLYLGSATSAGSRGRLAASGHWLWRWKKHIDRSFMSSFHDLYAALPELPVRMQTPGKVAAAIAEPAVDPAQRCAGCGGKLPASMLASALREATGTYRAEDASISAWPSDTLVQTTDLLRSPIDDPWLFGRIATLHALNDLYAMNAQAHSLQVGLTLPYAAEHVQERELRQLLQGILSVCREHAVQLTGGHSAEGNETSLCLTVNGTPGTPTFHKQGLQAGQLLVLSKPLGSGLVFAAHMLQRCPGTVLRQALIVLQQSQAARAQWLAVHGTTCATDVSGFGLLGHLVEMLDGKPLRITFNLEDMPVLPGARELAARGIRSSLAPSNEAFVLKSGYFNALQEHALWPLLLDPQTSGGLLAAIAPEQEAAARTDGWWVIGRVLAGNL